ncbi:MAG: hypothetical protein ACK4ON_03860, partial [Bacteroidia bacterium]
MSLVILPALVALVLLLTVNTIPLMMALFGIEKFIVKLFNEFFTEKLYFVGVMLNQLLSIPDSDSVILYNVVFPSFFTVTNFRIELFCIISKSSIDIIIFIDDTSVIVLFDDEPPSVVIVFIISNFFQYWDYF